MKILDRSVIDGNKLTVEEAAELAKFKAWHNAPTPARAVGASTRSQIEALLEGYHQARIEWQAVPVNAPRSLWRIADKQFRTQDRLLNRAQREAFKEFAKPRGWKYEGTFSIGDLHTEALSMTWCETCGGLCQAGPLKDILHSDHDGGRTDAFRSLRDYNGRTEAVMLHTVHPLQFCIAVAERFRLKVTPFDFSWYGKPLAVLFERRGSK